MSGDLCAHCDGPIEDGEAAPCWCLHGCDLLYCSETCAEWGATR